MSQLPSSGAGDASDTTGATGQLQQQSPEQQLPLDQRPERPNADVKEKKGAGPCTLRYFYPVQKTDDVRWSMPNTKDGNMIYIRCEIRRQGSDRMAYLHKSRDMPPELKEKLRYKGQSFDTKNGCCKVELEKTADFDLTPFFRKASPVAGGGM